jgi:hypothetical protein
MDAAADDVKVVCPSSFSISLGSLDISCGAPHELRAMQWWGEALADARKAAFLAGVYVVRNGLVEGLMGDARRLGCDRAVAERDEQICALAGRLAAERADAERVRVACERELAAVRAGVERRLVEAAEAAEARAAGVGGVELMRARAERDGALGELERLRASSAELADARVAAAAAEAGARCAAKLEDALRANARATALHEAARGRLEELEACRRREGESALQRQLDEAAARARAAEEQLAAFKQTNHGKGVVGEALVAQALRARFEQLEVEDKGGVGGSEAHCQDVWLRMSPSAFVAFESKLKKTITKADVDKFYADLEAMPCCAGAMLVSLASRNIPGKGSFSVELHAGRRPVMFVGFGSPDEFARFFGDYAQVLLLLSQHAAAAAAASAASAEAGADGKERDHAAAEQLAALVRALAPLVERIRRAKNDLAQVGAGLRTAGRAVDALQGSLDGLFADMERLLATASSHTARPDGPPVEPEPGVVGPAPEKKPRARPRKGAHA